MKTFLLFLCLFLMFGFTYQPQDINDEALADAIFKAEGSYDATWLYGIRSVHYDNEADARRICLNTIRNNKIRFQKQNKYDDFIEFLGSRYCPTEGDLSNAEKKLNGNWIRNVRRIYERSA